MHSVKKIMGSAHRSRERNSALNPARVRRNQSIYIPEEGRLDSSDWSKESEECADETESDAQHRHASENPPGKDQVRDKGKEEKKRLRRRRHPTIMETRPNDAQRSHLLTQRESSTLPLIRIPQLGVKKKSQEPLR